MRTPVSIGVVGGRAALPLARAFADCRDADLRWICDANGGELARTRSFAPELAASELDRLLGDETLDAVAVVGPAATHHDLARRALTAGKHVLVSEPLARQVQEVDSLAALAERQNRRLMAAHELLYDPAVRKLKELIEVGRLGELYYVDAVIRAPGGRNGDQDVLWAHGSRILAAVLYVLGDEPVEVSARGDSYLNQGIADVVACYLRFATGIAATVRLSSLDPRRTCRLAAFGARRTAVFDEYEQGRRLTVYEQLDGDEARSGEILVPRLPRTSPLELQCESFLAGARSGTGPPRPQLGRRVVALLETIERTLGRDERGARERPQERRPPHLVVLPPAAEESGGRGSSAS